MTSNAPPFPGAAKALVLQGGGALGAYELGAARRLYRDGTYAPDVIAGVSIGAITAVLLARPKSGKPLDALEKFWKKIAVSGWYLPPGLHAYASAFGNPAFFVPRQDVVSLASWTSFYDLSPLRRTLEELVDLDALRDISARPRLLVTATEIETGEIAVFDSGSEPLSLQHVLASASLPPSFPPTVIGNAQYWDGGLFDNTPLGSVLDCLDASAKKADEREVIVVNLFPNRMPAPTNLNEVGQRMLNLMFENRTHSDVKLLRRFNAVAALVDKVKEDPRWADLRSSPEFQEVADKCYLRVPNLLEITPTGAAESASGMDFSPEGITAKANRGFRDASEALEKAALAA